MVRKIAMAFVPKDGTEVEKRSIYGMVCGFVGIFFNIILFVGKLLAGIITSSISITADALNNLSDAGSSIVTLAGFKLAAQKPDSKHPYGHGRIEYLAGLAVAAVILIMGFELFRDSIGKVLRPQNTEFSYVVIFILLASILVKCYMAYYNYSIGKEIDSAAVRAAAMDSMSDCIATGAVLVTTVLNHLYGWQLDGYCGILVSLFIMYSGIQAARDSVDPLLGIEPDEEFLQQIEDISLSFDENIVGIHDLMVHDYGPGRVFISLHAEVPGNEDIFVIHDEIDNAEIELQKTLGCHAVIHMDPVCVDDGFILETKEKVNGIVKGIDPVFSIHDFRMVPGDTHTNLIFDLVVPAKYKLSNEEVGKIAKE